MNCGSAAPVLSPTEPNCFYKAPPITQTLCPRVLPQHCELWKLRAVPTALGYCAMPTTLLAQLFPSTPGSSR